jgi:hypothetical protein
MVRAIAAPMEPGAIFRRCPVVTVVPFGAFVDIAPGKQGLVHVSEYDKAPTPDMTKVAVVRRGWGGAVGGRWRRPLSPHFGLRTRPCLRRFHHTPNLAPLNSNLLALATAHPKP